MLGPPAVFPGARFRVYVSVGRPIQTNIFTILFNDHRHWHFLEITMPFLNLGDVLRLLQNSKKKAWRHPEGRPLAQEQTRTPRKLPLKKLNKSSAIVHNHASNVPPPPAQNPLCFLPLCILCIICTQYSGEEVVWIPSIKDRAGGHPNLIVTGSN